MKNDTGTEWCLYFSKINFVFAANKQNADSFDSAEVQF